MSIRSKQALIRLVLVAGVSMMICFQPARASSAAIEDDAIANLLATQNWRVEVLSDELSYPWNIERSENLLIITEAAGSVVVIDRGVFTRYPLQTTVPVVQQGGSGLLGMALTKDFDRTGVAYLYHSYRDGERLANRVIRAVFDGRGWRETDVLVDEIPGHRLYNGGRLSIGPDDHLYVTTGWTEDRDLPRDRRSLAGKILRIGLDGSVPADNPYGASFVYSIGHRNPQGLAWSPDGKLYVSEHGQIGNDEINLVMPGADYGWPVVEGDATHPGVDAPLVHSGRQTWAPSGIAFSGKNLLMTGLRDRSLHRYEIGGRLEVVYRSDDRLRDVLVTSDGLYLITTNRSPRSSGPSTGDRLLRLSTQ